MIGSPSPTEFSLYFHIPFCTKKCDYCHFYVIPDKEPSKDQLLEAFQWEWKKILPNFQGKTLSTIYFGGGTPSLFGPHRINQMLELIRDSGIPTAPKLEITLEANPELTTVPLMKGYADAGINRVSLGIQTLDAELLKLLGRLHDPEIAQKAVFATHEAGISNISVDLMYDLPKQTIGHWEHTLDQIQLLPITHLSLYNLTIEPHTLFYKKQSLLTPLLPDAETSLEMYEMAVDRFERMGLKAYEISAFAREGYYSRHNTGYWTGRQFWGLGPSAFSYWDGKRFRNCANLNKYRQALKEGQSPVDFEEQLDPEAHRRELLVIRLRLKEGVSVREFEEIHGELDHETRDHIEKLVREELLEERMGRIFLTKRGVLFYDTIASDLI